jgi:hypothetical protein
MKRSEKDPYYKNLYGFLKNKIIKLAKFRFQGYYCIPKGSKLIYRAAVKV